jgi:iron(III) transport system ATP-binding protein
MNSITIQNLGKQFAKHSPWAVQDFSLQVQPGTIMALLGESGCGKTTILRLIAGFEKPSTGTIQINQQTVCSPHSFIQPQQRNVGFVFQDYALFPHLTTTQNIALGLWKLPANKAQEQVTQVVELCGLQGLEARYPHQLSGGQKQRVALARALAPKPAIILLDEPFSNLDSARTQSIRQDIQQIIQQTSCTALFVTHDTKDAFAIAHSVCIMHQGRAIQYGTPLQLYNEPATPYVGSFFGACNYIPAKPSAQGWQTEFGIIHTPHIPSPTQSGVQSHSSKTHTLAIRPHQILIQSLPSPCSPPNPQNDPKGISSGSTNSFTNSFAATIQKIQHWGSHSDVFCQIQGSQTTLQIAIYTQPQALQNNQPVHITIPPQAIWVMS